MNATLLIVPIIAMSGGASAGAFSALCVAGVVVDNNLLRFVCITGACFGSVVSLIFYPPTTKEPSVRELCLKFVGSVLTSVTFSPFLIRWMNPTPDPEFVLFWSGGVGLCAFTVITAIKRAVAKKTKSVLED